MTDVEKWQTWAPEPRQATRSEIEQAAQSKIGAHHIEVTTAGRIRAVFQDDSTTPPGRRIVDLGLYTSWAYSGRIARAYQP